MARIQKYVRMAVLMLIVAAILSPIVDSAQSTLLVYRIDSLARENERERERVRIVMKEVCPTRSFMGCQFDLDSLAITLEGVGQKLVRAHLSQDLQHKAFFYERALEEYEYVRGRLKSLREKSASDTNTRRMLMHPPLSFYA